MNISPTISIIISLIFALAGLIICFFGYRIFRFVLAVAGFIIGSSFIAGVAYTLTEGQELLVIIIAGLAGGFIAALSLLFLYSAGVFLLGVLFGIVIFSGTSFVGNYNIAPTMYVIPALLGGVLALILQRFMLILITSLIGAWITVICVLYMIVDNFNQFTPDFINNLSDIELYRILLSWLALGTLGFVTQYIIFPKKALIPEKTEDYQK